MSAIPTLSPLEFAARIRENDVEAYGDTTTRELRTFEDGSQAIAILVTLAMRDGSKSAVWRLVPAGVCDDE